MRLKQFLFEGDMDKKRWTSYINHMPMLAAGVKILNKINSLGYTSYIVGGAVRDLVIGKEPKDIDIAGNCPLEIIQENFPRTSYIGQSGNFGIIVIHQDNYEFEYALYRSESYEIPTYVRKVLK